MRSRHRDGPVCLAILVFESDTDVGNAGVVEFLDGVLDAGLVRYRYQLLWHGMCNRSEAGVFASSVTSAFHCWRHGERANRSDGSRATVVNRISFVRFAQRGTIVSTLLGRAKRRIIADLRTDPYLLYILFLAMVLAGFWFWHRIPQFATVDE